MSDATRLHWKFEDGPEDAEEAQPNDVGPAWLIRPDATEEEVQDGEWITRAEAQALAEARGYILALDG